MVDPVASWFNLVGLFHDLAFYTVKKEAFHSLAYGIPYETGVEKKVEAAKQNTGRLRHGGRLHGCFTFRLHIDCDTNNEI